MNSLLKAFGILMIICFSFTACWLEAEEMEEQQAAGNYAKARKNMVQQQIIARGIKDSQVLKAMLSVPRHEFVPEAYWHLAYRDHPLPIGRGQTISQPYIVALMTELLQLKGGEKVLEIGTGSGYQTAVLAKIAGQVHSIEIICELANRAAADLKRLGYENVKVRCGDGYQGWPEAAPFDAIIVTAAPPEIPPPLTQQLKVGGKLVLPLGEHFQELVLITKTESGLQKTNILPVRFVPMTGEAQKEKSK